MPGEVTASAPALPQRVAGRSAGVRAARALAEGVLPAAITLLVMRYFVAPEASGVGASLSSLARRSPVPFAIALFLALAATAHYWTARLFDSERLARARSPGRGALVTAALVIAATIAALALRSYGVRSYRVHGSSMVPTLVTDDLVAGTPWSRASEPHRGDVIVFSPPRDGPPRVGWRAAGSDEIVKRVVGVPGDRIEVRAGALVINGWTVPSCEVGDLLYVSPGVGDAPVHGHVRVEFLEDAAYLTLHTFAPPFTGPYVVKPGEVFVVGDDRGRSFDSRSLDGGRGGGVALQDVTAKVAWFLLGTERSGDVDTGRFLRSIRSLEHEAPAYTRSTSDVAEGVARCLASRPSETRPPAPTF